MGNPKQTGPSAPEQSEKRLPPRPLFGRIQSIDGIDDAERLREDLRTLLAAATALPTVERRSLTVGALTGPLKAVREAAGRVLSVGRVMVMIHHDKAEEPRSQYLPNTHRVKQGVDDLEKAQGTIDATLPLLDQADALGAEIDRAAAELAEVCKKLKEASGNRLDFNAAPMLSSKKLLADHRAQCLCNLCEAWNDSRQTVITAAEMAQARLALLFQEIERSRRAETPRGHGARKKGSRYKTQAAALGCLKDHPDWTNQQIAREIECSPSTLSRMTAFQKRRDEMREEAKAALRKTRAIL